MKAIKRIFIQRPEPLLLIVPLLLFALTKIFDGDVVLDIHHQENNLLQLDSSILFWIVFAFIAVPFLLHFLLRASGKWDAVFCRPHVYLTIGLLVSMFITFYSVSQPLPENFFTAPQGGKVIDYLSFNKTFASIFLIEWALQFLFVIYFLIRIFQRAR